MQVDDVPPAAPRDERGDLEPLLLAVAGLEAEHGTHDPEVAETVALRARFHEFDPGFGDLEIQQSNAVGLRTERAMVLVHVASERRQEPPLVVALGLFDRFDLLVRDDRKESGVSELRLVALDRSHEQLEPREEGGIVGAGAFIRLRERFSLRVEQRGLRGRR